MESNPFLELWQKFLDGVRQKPLVIEAQKISQAGEIYHGVLVAYVSHLFLMDTIAQAGQMTYTNRTGKDQYVQSISMSAVGGTPTVSLEIGDEFYTAAPASTGTGNSVVEKDFTLAVDFTDNATDEKAETRLGPNQNITLKNTGGTGSIAYVIKLAQGKETQDSQVETYELKSIS